MAQRYTPVPGFGSQSNEMSHLNTQGGYGGATMQHRDGPYPGSSNPFATPNYQEDTNPFQAPETNWDQSRPSGMGNWNDQGSSTHTNDMAYQNVPSESYWPETKGTGYQSAPKSSKKKWWIIGGVIAAVAVIAVVVGVVVSQVTKKSSSSGSGSGSSKSGSSSGDASNFAKDSRLHQSFWGFAYTPQSAQPPWCGATQQNVTRDVQLLSQLTTRVRLYGATCNVTALVLQAIQDTKVNMTIWPAIYVDSNETAYEIQKEAIKDALTTYGTDHVSGITVGNEYILDTAGSDSNTSSAYISAASDIAKKVQDVNSTIQGLSLSKTLPVGTSDAGSLMSTTLGADINYFMANVHPWFGALPIDEAAAWTNSFFNNFDVSVADDSTGQPESYIAETGWPTDSLNATLGTDGAGSPQGDASVANLQTFLDTFVCQANSNGTKYFYFEAFDEPWKAQYGGVEPFWGLFDSNRNLKNVKIPQC